MLFCSDLIALTFVGVKYCCFHANLIEIIRLLIQNYLTHHFVCQYYQKDNLMEIIQLFDYRYGEDVFCWEK